MKPFRIFIRVWISLAAACVLSGCREAEISSAESDTSRSVPAFSPKNGLFLPEQTKRSIGLKLVEVIEQPVESIHPLTLRVYETSATGIMASGMIGSTQADKFIAGQQVEARLADNASITGTIREIRADLQPVTDSHELLVAFPPGSKAAVGDFIPATLRRATAAGVVTIPKQALLVNSEGTFAYTVSGEQFVRTAIRTGGGNDQIIEVTDGLYSGDQVVLQPVMSLWLAELAAVKGGQSCCAVAPKKK